MNSRFMHSIILTWGFIFALFLGMQAFSFAPAARAQTNDNARIAGRLSEYSPLNAPLLTRASRGEAVRDVQAVLQWLGFYDGAIDGIYGPKTASAVTAFQRSQRLVGDGRVGTLTWQALRSNIPPVRRRF
ncbi:peptidoglycan-binding protein [Scytonema sp. UIC 10036]|uniref:peptidoglycan-binding domain-containing protein n=1 Tax=Scytonema sp. UIC 10036 TaxID=2304196 RepID=UPI0012DAA0D7|nr:peptidoglycan-binding domain-containing protein [Scytonema sp. UIC 10036]MUG91418.1 peptidoglycan-binding protein [Scytonema sp. UIC 10036]